MDIFTLVYYSAKVGEVLEACYSSVPSSHVLPMALKRNKANVEKTHPSLVGDGEGTVGCTQIRQLRISRQGDRADSPAPYVDMGTPRHKSAAACESGYCYTTAGSRLLLLHPPPCTTRTPGPRVKSLTYMVYTHTYFAADLSRFPTH